MRGSQKVKCSNDWVVACVQLVSVSSCSAVHPNSSLARLIAELPVLVIAEKCDPDGGQGIRLEQPQALLKGVVNVDAATETNDHGTTSSALN